MQKENRLSNAKCGMSIFRIPMYQLQLNQSDDRILRTEQAVPFPRLVEPDVTHRRNLLPLLVVAKTEEHSILKVALRTCR